MRKRCLEVDFQSSRTLYSRTPCWRAVKHSGWRKGCGSGRSVSGAQFHSTPEGWARAVMFNWCSAAHWCVREFLKHAIPDYLVRSTDLFSLRLSNKKLTTANITIAIQCEWIKIIPIFSVRLAKIYFWGVPQNFSNYFICAMRHKMLKIFGLEQCIQLPQVLVFPSVKCKALLISQRMWKSNDLHSRHIVSAQ